MINTDMEMRKLLNILNENGRFYSDDDIQTLAGEATQEAINAAAAYIQRRLGVESGDYAGIYFSDDEQVDYIYNVLKDYLIGEIQNGGGRMGDDDEGDIFDPEDDATA